MRKWGARRLTAKVYWTTAIGFLLFVTLFMVLQLFFFESYSLKIRSSQLREDFQSLYDEIQAEPSQSDQMKRVVEFDNMHYSLTGIAYKKGDQVDVYLGTRPLQMNVKRVPIDGPTLSIDLMTADPGENAGKQEKTVPLSSKRIEYKVPEDSLKENVPLRDIQSIDWYNADALRLNNMLQSYLGDMLLTPLHGEIRTELVRQDRPSHIKEDGERVWTAIAQLEPDQGTERYLVAVSTLEPVSDAAKMLGGFYQYFYAAAILLLFGFAYLFSKMISSPLVKLNQAAKRLAKLDFSIRTDIQRKDEIGELAGTLDYLATELRDTMGELQEANHQLQLDIEKEKKLERLRKRFVASVSHELKTPVSLIQGYAEALLDNVGQGEKREKYATVIVNEADRMSRLVHDLLDLSQLESGKFRLQWHAVPLRNVILQTLNTLSSLSNSRKLQLHWGLVEDEIQVRSDLGRLQQIFTNVLTNAIRHAEGSGSIVVSVRSSARMPNPSGEGGAWVEVTVFNPGRSISEEHLSHLWDAFYRTDESGSRHDGGYGIGLSIVKNLLEKHGSQYIIQNAHGGVEVVFDLPIWTNTDDREEDKPFIREYSR